MLRNKRPTNISSYGLSSLSVIIVIIFQYLYRNVKFSEASLNGVLILLGVDFCGGRKPECPEKTLEVRLRSTETQSTNNIFSRGGRRD